jgi:secondary thiamine-phosphate synthase enzyme
MRQATHSVSIATHGKGLYAFTEQVIAWVRDTGIHTGLLTLYVRHTSASLLIQENYDPDVQSDLARFFARLAPDGDPLFAHTMEGPDDMPAHVRAALTQTSISIPVLHGAPTLGTWQGIYLFEHRIAAQRREVVLHLIGEE